jgi:soluble lytic murein transglycosylase-like protein
VGSFAGAAANADGAAISDATASARYVPALPSKVDEEWDAWIKSADEVIRVVGGAARAKANATDIVYEALRAGLEPELVFALVEVSSRFDEHAVSRRGGVGLLVLSRQVHERFGNKVNTLFMGKYNLRLGCAVLRHYVDIESGNVGRALQRFFEEASLGGAGADEFTRTYEARRAQLQPSNPLPR